MMSVKRVATLPLAFLATLLLLAGLAALAVMPVKAWAAEEVISYELHDGYGDGWNGASIEIMDTADNSTLASLTFDSGYNAEGTVSLICGHVYQFVWKSAYYSYECSFTFKSGETIILDRAQNTLGNDEVLLTYVAREVITNYSLWVADTQVTSANAADVLGDGTVSYDVEKKTLTLDNCACVRDGGDSGNASLIYVGDADGPITIDLKGNNVLEGGPGDQYGIYTHADMTITGDGSLTVVGGGSYSGSASSFGVYSVGSITLDGSFTGTVVAKGAATAGQSIGFSGPNVIVNGGTLIAEGGVGVDNNSIGLQAGTSLSVAGGTVVAQGGSVAKGNSIGVDLGDNATISVTGGTVLVQGGNTSNSSGHSRGVNCGNGGKATFSGGASVVRAGAVGTDNYRFSNRNRSLFGNCEFSYSGMSATMVGYSRLGVFVSGSNTPYKTGFACVPSSWKNLNDTASSSLGDSITLSNDCYFISAEDWSPQAGCSSIDTNGYEIILVNLFEGDPTNRAAGLVLTNTGDVSLTGTGSVVAVGGLTTADPSFGLYASGSLTVTDPTVIGVSGQGSTGSDGISCASGLLTVSSGKVIGVGSSPIGSSNDSHGVNIQDIVASGTGSVVGVGGITTSVGTYGIKAQNITAQNSASVLGVGGSITGSGANSYGIGASSMVASGGTVAGVGGDRAAGSRGVDSGSMLVYRGAWLNAVGGVQTTDHSYGVSGLTGDSLLAGDAAIAGTTSAIGSSDGVLQLDETGLAFGCTNFAGTAGETAIENGAALSTLSGYKHIEVDTPPFPLESGDCGTCYWEITPDKVLMVYPGDLAPAENGAMPWIPDSEATWAISDIERVVLVSRGEAKVVAPANSSSILGQLSSAQSMDLSGLDTSHAQDLSSMFAGCSALESLDVSMLDTSSATTAQSMFQGCSALGSLDLSALDMATVANTSGMFSDCTALESFSLPAAGMAGVTDASGMFAGCSSLASLDLSAAGMAGVTDASGMFAGCSSLASLDLSAAGMTNLTNTSGMFAGCTSLQSLDLSALDMTGVTDAEAEDMFSGCTSLASLKLGSACKLASNAALHGAPTTHPYTGKWIRQEGGEPLTAAELMSGYDGTTMAGTYVWEQIVQRTPDELAQLIETATTTSPYKDVDSVQTSADGTDVYILDTWVTQDVKDALINTLAAAQQVAANEEATQEQIDVAYYALEAAMANYVPQQGTKERELVEVTTWSQLYELLKENGSIIKLTDDVKYGTGGGAHESDALVVPAGFSATLDLNGHIIDRGLGEAPEAVEGGSVIDVFGELTITDSAPAATHNPAFTFEDPLSSSQEKVTVTGGIITGGYAVSQYDDQKYFGGGGMLVERNAHLILTGGSICRNRATDGVNNNGGGGGVAIKHGGVVDMSGTAAVCGNVSEGDGGGVFLYEATLNMDEDASINGNYANGGEGSHGMGGGVEAQRSNVNMKGSASVTGNRASVYGGGVGLFMYSALNMEGDAAIMYNDASMLGGGVMVNPMWQTTEMSVTIKDRATISRNTAGWSGGGVYISGRNAVITMEGDASINNNRSSSDGGGVEAYGGATLNMLGGEIMGNYAFGQGGGVSLGDNSKLNITDGVIANNSAHEDGGGVYAEYSTAVITLSGAVVIDGNETIDENGDHTADSNLYGNSWGGAMNTPITVTGPLAEGSTIGIDKWGTPTSDTPIVAIDGFGENNPENDYTDFFHFDNDDYIVATNDEGDVTIRSIAKYGLWLAGTQVTERNAGDILGNGTASYNPETGTLTLAGATIGQGSIEGVGTCGIAATGLETLHIELAEGTSSSISASSADPDEQVAGIYCSTNVIINGTGTLDIDVDSTMAVGITAPDGYVRVYDGASVLINVADGGMTGIEATSVDVRDAVVGIDGEAEAGISATSWVYLYGTAHVEAQGKNYGVWCTGFLMEDYAYLNAKGTGRSAHGLHFDYDAVEDQYGNSVDNFDIRHYAQLEAQGIGGAVDKALRTDFYDTSTTAKTAIKTAVNAPQEQLVDTSIVDPMSCFYVRMPAYRAYPVMVATPAWEEGKPYLTQVDSSNADDVFGDGTVSYDPDTNVLTLNGYHYTVGCGDQATVNALQIDRSMTVELVGDNSISSGAYATCQRAAVDANIFNLADLTFAGDGALDIDWNANDSLDAAVVGCNITVAGNADVNVTATKHEANEDYPLFAGVWTYGDLVVCDNASLATTAACASEEVDGIAHAIGACVSENGRLVVSDKAEFDVSGSDGAILDYTQNGLAIDYSGYEQVEGYELPMVEICMGARGGGNRLAAWDGETSLSATFDSETGTVTRQFRWVRIGPWEYDLWVSGTRVSMLNAADMFGDGTVSYDPLANVLHMNGFAYEGVGDENYHAVIASGIEGLTIDVAGENSVTETSTTYTSFGIYSDSDLVFTGEGTLAAVGGRLDNEAYVSAGVYVKSGAMIVGEGFTGTLTALSLGGAGNSRGIHVNDGTLMVSGGNVAARAGDVASLDEAVTSYGIYAGGEGDIAFTGGQTYAEAGSVAAGSDGASGINAGIKKAGTGDIYITGKAEVGAHIPEGKVAATESCGFCSDGSIYIDVEGKTGGQVISICEDANRGIGAHAASDLSICGAWVLFAGGAGAATAEGITLGSALIALGSEELSWDNGATIATNKDDSLLGITELVTPLYKTVWTQALETYDLWVNGERFNNEKLTITCGEGTAVFDPEAETPTLTLTNATITNHSSVASMNACIYSELPNLVIKTVGDNLIQPAESGIDGVGTADDCNIAVVSEGEELGTLNLKDVKYGFNLGGTVSVAGNLEIISTAGGTNVPDSAIALAQGWGYTKGTSLTQSGDVAIGQVITLTFDGNGRGGVLATLQVPKGASANATINAMSEEARAELIANAAGEVTDNGKTYRVYDYYANPDGSSSVNWDAPLNEDVTWYAQWLERIDLVEITVEPPVCGTTTKTEKDGEGNWIYYRQTNKPNITAISPNCGFAYYSGDDFAFGWLEGTVESVLANINSALPYQGTFSGGASYVMWGNLLAYEGYYFSQDVAVKVNGVEGALIPTWIWNGGSIGFLGEVTAVHDLTETPTVPATCTEGGVAAYWTCAACDKMFSDAAGTKQITAPVATKPLGHSWDAGKVSVEPTIGAEGVRTFTCTRDTTHTLTEAIPKVDGTPLKDAITAAKAAEKGVAVSTDGSDVKPSGTWVTQATKSALDTAISDAEKVLGNKASTQAQVDAAKAAVTKAQAAFDKAKKPGTKKGDQPVPPDAKVDKSALEDAIDAAQAAENGVAVSTDGSDVEPSGTWVTQAAKSALDTAITDAEKVLGDKASTQAQVDAAKAAVAKAQAAFEAAKKPGTKKGDQPVPPEPGETLWTRLAGDSAFKTMDAIINEGNFAAGGTVVLASLEGYWDALTAAGVAGLEKAPVVMSLPEGLSPEATAQLAKLAPKKIVVCGGTYWLPDALLAEAAAAAGTSPEVVRLAGDNAALTAGQIAAYGKGKWSNTAIVATAGTFQDALAAAPVSYAKGMPIFLAQFDFATETGYITADTIKAMKDAGIKQCYIAGGTYWLPAQVKADLEKAGIEVLAQLGGKSAVETSGLIAELACGTYGMSANNMGAANVEQHYDALASAAFCGKNNSVLVLVSDTNRSVVDSFVAKNASKISQGYVFGGTGSVSEASMKALEAATK